MANGYMGKVLWVDLTQGKLTEEELDENLCRDFIGGYGLGARLLYDRQKLGADALGPDNIFGFVTGPFTGAAGLFGSRYTIVGKSPLTGGWGDANGGGTFGPALKFAGYDAVFFTGISPKPVYLFIDSGKAELRDAGHLWGKDCYEVEDILKAQHGASVEIASIGPSGEKLSFISCLINDKGRAPGRSGLGAVLGSKRLKAVVAKGSLPVPLADKAKAEAVRWKYLPELKKPSAQSIQDYGTCAGTAESALSGDSPVKNWGGVGVVDFPDAEPIGGNAVIAKQRRKYGCWGCPIACGGLMKPSTPTSDYTFVPDVHKPEYETLAAFGTLNLNNNLDSITKANDICNRYGLDTISAGAVMGFAIECYENGILTKADTDGLELTWGNHRAIIAMTEKVAKREGLGDILADGVKVAAEKIGKGAEKYAVHVGGQEPGMHDPKFYPALTMSFLMDATPGRHTQGGEDWVPDDLGLSKFDKRTYTGRGEPHKIGSGLTHVVNAAGMCLFVLGITGANSVVEFFNAVTGWNYTLEDLLQVGERIANMRLAFNLREGISNRNIFIHDRILGRPAQTEGPLKGVTVDLETLAKQYLAAMDWDPVTNKPNRRKLEQLGLDDLAQALWATPPSPRA